MNLLANATVAFDRHPDQWDSLYRDPDRSRSAAEEMLRYDGPIHAMARWAKEPLELGGKRIEKFDRVLLHQTAANHDPAAFPDPARFDPSRADNQHLAFGHGIHYCLGAPLARLEGEVAFTGLLDSFDRIELAVPADQLEWRYSVVMRGLERLPVRLGRGT
jgi:cytochrome P450